MSTLNSIGMDTTTGQFKIALPADLLTVPTSIIGLGGTPTIVLGSGATGSGATYSITGTNIAGSITINSGTGILATGIVFTMTFADSLTYPHGCFVTFSAGNAAFAALAVALYVTTTTTTAVVSTAVAISISTTYIGSYHITGY